MSKYVGSWDNFDEMISDWEIPADKIVPISDADVIVAAYGGGAYEGAAFVLFKHDGKLYEVNGSHCSCFGLEGQWNPEETFYETLAKRDPEYTFDTIDDGCKVWAEMLEEVKAMMGDSIDVDSISRSKTEALEISQYEDITEQHYHTNLVKREDLDTVKRQLIETQQTLIKLVDAMKKQQEQINALVKWAQENSDDVSPGGIIKPS